MPVLQARQGKLVALGKMDGAAVPVVQPVFEAIVYGCGSFGVTWCREVSG